MGNIGFSTGALAKGDFHKALSIISRTSLNAVELSALRMSELLPMVSAVQDKQFVRDLNSRYSYISIHAPSYFNVEEEELVVEQLSVFSAIGWPIVVHPDSISSFKLWSRFGSLLCIENMDNRKPIGRTAKELRMIYDRLPEASLCFDIGHAYQIDPSLSVAFEILKEFKSKLGQVHWSYVDSHGAHKSLSNDVCLEFARLSHAIPKKTPYILETPGQENVAVREIRVLEECMGVFVSRRWRKPSKHSSNSIGITV